MYCIHCGASNSDQDEYCESCGHALQKNEHASVKPASQNRQMASAQDVHS